MDYLISKMNLSLHNVAKIKATPQERDGTRWIELSIACKASTGHAFTGGNVPTTEEFEISLFLADGVNVEIENNERENDAC